MFVKQSTHPGGSFVMMVGEEYKRSLFDGRATYFEGEREIQAFMEEAQDRDVRITQCITDAKGDRSRPPGKQDDPNAYVRVVDRQADGVVIRGAKLHITGASLGHELMTIPTKAMKAGEEDYAIAAMVPVNSPGVKIVDVSYAPRHDELRDFPISGHHHVAEGFVIFDDVFVPNDRIFLNGEVACLEACLTHAETGPFGAAFPNELYTNAGKYTGAASYNLMVRHLHDIAGGAIVTAPSISDLENAEVGHLARKYMSTMNGVDGEYRTRLFHAIRDLTADSYGGWSQVTNIQAGGGLYAQRIVTRRHYDLDGAKQAALQAAGLAESH